MADRTKYWKSVVVVGALFIVVNLFLFRQEFSCFDCMHTYGFPLPIYAVGGFKTVEMFSSISLMIDLFTLLFLAAVVSWTWRRFFGGNTDLERLK